MQAVYIEAHGGPEVLTHGERPEPATLPQQVKIQVGASSLNRLDLYTRNGDRGLQREFPPPLILGGDCAGQITEVGSEVRGFSVGDRVLVNPKITCGQCQACLAGHDVVAVPAANVHAIGDDVTYEMAAAVPTTYLPVWNMLLRKIQLKPWETVLVLSASGGVGTAAIQVASKAIGARVIATTSTPEKAAKARELGADEVINYNEEDITERARELTGGRGVDAVVDHVGADFFPKAFGSLRAGGRYGICGATTGLRTELHLGLLFSRQIEIFGIFMGTKQDMHEITSTLNRGVIHPVVHQVYPLAEAAAAHQAMEGQNFFGKLVLKP